MCFLASSKSFLILNLILLLFDMQVDFLDSFFKYGIRHVYVDELINFMARENEWKSGKRTPCCGGGLKFRLIYFYPENQ